MLRPFTDTPRCPKCGNGDIAWRFFEVLPKGVSFRGWCNAINRYVRPAHHFMHCRRCSYDWMMRCKPKEPKGTRVSQVG